MPPTPTAWSSPVALWRGLPVFWRVQIVGWTVFTFIDLIDNRVLERGFSIAFYRTALVVPSLMLITWGMGTVYGSARFRNRLSGRSLAWLVLLSLAGGLAVAALLLACRIHLGWATPGRDAAEDFYLPLLHTFIALAIWSLCYFWVHAELAEQAERRHAARAEAEALRAELEELRLQLDPHFLFNALNGVAEEIPDHPTAALAMLRDLTAYLRHSLEGINQTVVPVEAEVAGLSAYLRVQQARFGERLKVVLDVEPQASGRRIASFLLQPLVENAVKHGRRDPGLELCVSIRAPGEALQVEIENTGSLTAHSTRRRRPGIGLENVRRRLALHYPGRHRFSLEERAAGSGKVLATLILEGEPCGS
jgi:signal transduction histidine kinase